MVALTPAIARLAVRRPGCDGGPRALKVAMAGAGPVDAALDDRFRERFGVGLARNYGSSETGALFAGLPPLPPACIGGPMPGVRYRLSSARRSPDANADQGELEVSVSGGPWVSTNDVVMDHDGTVTMLGRLTSLARRGDRWVSPVEVETVLRTCPYVRDVDVRRSAGRFPADDRLVVDVVLEPGRDAQTVFEYARAHLAAYKVPDVVNVVDAIARTATGKASTHAEPGECSPPARRPYWPLLQPRQPK